MSSRIHATSGLLRAPRHAANSGHALTAEGLAVLTLQGQAG